MKILLFLLLGLSPLLAADPPTMIYLVRHAEKVDTSDTSGLTAKGKARAHKLAQFLAHVELDAVYTSQFRRTKDTVKPLLQSRQTPHHVVPSDHSADLVANLTQSAGQTVLVCGHSNTIPEILQLLGGPLNPIDDSDYDNLYLVVRTDQKTVVQRFRMTVSGDTLVE